MALYPPIVASSMPAFNINNKKVRIYYTLSDYNNAKKDKIKAVHIICSRQSSNVNVLTSYSQIAVSAFGLQDEEDKLLNRYYVEIPNEKIQGGFKTNVLYKVQLRFSSIVSQETDETEKSARAFFVNNINKFSEWSTVCLIKPIYPPEFYIDDFYVEGTKPEQDDQNYFYNTLSDFVGIFKTNSIVETTDDSSITSTEKSTEILKYWRLRLLSDSYTSEQKYNIDTYTLADSGQQYVNSYNYTLNEESMVLQCSLPYELQTNAVYKLLFEIVTKNDYYDSLLYTFTCTPSLINPIGGTLTTYVNEEEGYIKLNYDSDGVTQGNLVLRRTDSKSNFLKWEDLKHFYIPAAQDLVYYDFTAESGIMYQYLLQKRDIRGRRGSPLYDQVARVGRATAAEWEHAFLLQTNGDGTIETSKQLKLKFDFTISSWKTNISESKTDTIGSKYPYIRRNGNMYYRSFGCSGLITSYMDNVDLFTSSQILNHNSSLYNDFKKDTNKYNVQYDFTYQRKFREQVEKFLYNSKPKLYKSMQEGNMIIKLMEISLTPKTELSRLIYTFTATAYEIDDYSIATLNSYNFINTGTYNTNPEIIERKLGQLNSYINDNSPSGSVFAAGQDIIGGSSDKMYIKSIAKKYKYLESQSNNLKLIDFNIPWLRITIESEPYLIKEVNGVFYPMDDVDNSSSSTLERDRLNKLRASMPSFQDKNYIQQNGTVGAIGNAAFDIPSDTGEVERKLYQIESTYHQDNSIYLGTLFDLEINGNSHQIIVSYPNNIYELKDENLLLSKNTKLIPYKDTALSIDFLIDLISEQDQSKVPKMIRNYSFGGQQIGVFNSSQNIINNINYKYKTSFSEDDDTIKQKLIGVSTALVDTEPGAVIYIKTSAIKQIQTEYRFVVNHTGELRFDPHDELVTITSLRISGINIPIEQLHDRGQTDDLNNITYPVDKDLCLKGSEYYIFYKNEWKEATMQDEGTSFDVECAVDALVFYNAEVRREFY